MPNEDSTVELLKAVDSVCDRFEAAWADVPKGEAGPRCEDAAAELDGPARARAMTELFAIERQYRADRGEAESDWVADRPEAKAHAAENREELETIVHDSAATRSGGLRLRCPQCSSHLNLLADAPLDEITCNACGSTFGLLGESDAALAAPAQIERFELVERLGVGGFGAVWRARDPDLDREVALKIPRRGGLSPREAEMFFREARAAAQMTHPGIVSVFEVGRDMQGAGSIYIVSELVHGEPLSDTIKEWRPSPRQTAGIIAQVADALEYAHSRGVIHRDLKPSNVMLDNNAPQADVAAAELGMLGRPRLMDFGLAKREVGEVTMTAEGQVMGTPAYMSPEQAAGQHGLIDRRTDIYALGVMLFRMLTGELPFRGTAASQIQQRQTDDPPSPRSLDASTPVDLATVCLKCIERDQNLRYDSSAEVAAEMRRYLLGEPVLARPLSAWARAGRWAKRRPASATALGLAAVLAVGGPSAATLLAIQSQELQGRLTEREEYIAEANKKIDALTREARQAPAWGNTIPAHRRKLMEQLLEGQERKIRDAIDALPEDSPEAARARVGYAYLLAGSERSEDAVAQLQRAESTLALTPDVDRSPELVALEAEASELQARLLAYQGEADAAERRFQVAWKNWEELLEDPTLGEEARLRRHALMKRRRDVSMAELAAMRKPTDAIELSAERLYEQSRHLIEAVE